MKKISIFVLSLFALCSCNGFLDMTPTDRVSPQVLWSSTANAEYEINYLYSYIWDLNSAPTVLGLTESLTDEMKYTSYNYNSLCYIPSEASYGGNNLTAAYIDSYFGYWGTLYTAIRKCNESLADLAKYGKMSDTDKPRLEAEIKFMRAFLYFELVKRYKDVIIYKDLNDIRKDAPLGTEEQAWDLIQEDLKFAAENLPLPAQANGRLNKGTAYGFTTRAMLYAKRYDAVITAADAVKELGYALEDNYSDAFKQGSKEAILQYLFSQKDGVTHSFNFYYTPGGDYAIAGQNGGAYGVPTQEIVESYELATGGFPNWTKWHGTSTETPPYALLEPRFQATILYNGSDWKGRKIEPFVGGTDGWATWKTDKEPKGKTVTGYYLRKLVDESYDVATSGSSQPFTFLRYAEVLLNKAEACALGPNKDETMANTILRDIRGRVGLPYTNKFGTELMAAIRQERKVELAFEGLRYWDLRRWEIADKDYPTGLSNYQNHGLKIEDNGDGTFTYTYVAIDDKDRSFEKKMYRFPIPKSELDNNPSFNHTQPDPAWN